MKKFDVSIIGAGPAGSILAENIKKKSDLDVVLFEKDNYPGEKNVCGGGLSKNTIEKLKPSDNIIDFKIKYYNAYMNKKNFVNSNNKIELWSVRREIFDRYLAERAVAVGTELHLNTKILDITYKNKEWELTAEKAQFKSKYLIFANGVSRKPKRNLNLGFHPNNENHWKSLIYEIECNNPPPVMDFFYGSKVAPLGYAWQFPKKDHLNVGIVIHSKYSNAELLKSGLKWVIDNHIKNRYDIDKIVRKRSAIIPLKMAEQFSSNPNSLVVGDAAGFPRPLDGGGIDYVIESALFASEKIIEFDNNGTPLKEYDDVIKRQTWFRKNKVENIFMDFFKRYPLFYHYFFKSRILPSLI